MRAWRAIDRARTCTTRKENCDRWRGFPGWTAEANERQSREVITIRSGFMVQALVDAHDRWRVIEPAHRDMHVTYVPDSDAAVRAFVNLMHSLLGSAQHLADALDLGGSSDEDLTKAIASLRVLIDRLDTEIKIVHPLTMIERTFDDEQTKLRAHFAKLPPLEDF